VHDEVAFNYRMPNINAALGCGQLEQLPDFLARKRRLAERYVRAFADVPGLCVFTEPADSRSNYWLNTLVLSGADRTTRDEVLRALNEAGLQSRPVWTPMHQLRMYRECPRMDMPVTEDLALRVINVPSGADAAVDV
jgi:perosamine synthetase